MRLKYISYQLLQSCMGSPDKMKALGFAIKFKLMFRTSVFAGFSLRGLAEAMGESVNTVRKRVGTLKTMGLAYEKARNGKRYLCVRQLSIRKERNENTGKMFRTTYRNISIDKLFPIDNIRGMKVKDYHLAIRTATIVDIIRKKDAARQLVENASKTNPKSKGSRKVAAQCGLDNSKHFIENGISYQTLQRINHCSKQTVRRMGDYGNSNGAFYKVVPERQVYTEKDGLLRNAFASASTIITVSNKIVVIPCARYVSDEGYALSIIPAITANSNADCLRYNKSKLVEEQSKGKVLNPITNNDLITIDNYLSSAYSEAIDALY